MRYKIWDKQESICTPSGHEFTAEEWLRRHAWAKRDGVKCVITAGPINGGVMMEFTSFVDAYRRRGCPIDPSTMSDEEILAAIEEFESIVPEQPPSVEERAVALEEFRVMATVDSYVPTKEIVEMNYRRKLWSDKMVKEALKKGAIDEKDYDRIRKRGQ